MKLKEISTKELVEELSRREGVITHCVAPDKQYIIQIESGYDKMCSGPSVILDIID